MRPTTRWEHCYLGQEQFPKTLSAVQIEHFFTLDEVELVSVRERRGPLNRLALALQIGFLKLTGRTLNSVELIPPQILDHLGRQVDCWAPWIASIRAFYRRRHRTLFEHHASALRLLARSELTPLAPWWWWRFEGERAPGAMPCQTACNWGSGALSMQLLS